MASEGQFVARVYEEDFNEIRKLVQHYPNIETGGDLFGLWENERTVNIQLFIGPGKKCERTTTSFHQDVGYLQRVGSMVTTEEGLCNVGEWHSHHQIGMPEPSAADRRTVFGNMPQLGLERFVLFIASISNQRTYGKKRSHDVKLDQIHLNCFLFLCSKQTVIRGKIIVISGQNPLSIHNRARSEIENGGEKPPGKEIKTPKNSDKDKLDKKASQKRNGKGSRKKQPSKTNTEDVKTLLQPTEALSPQKITSAPAPQPEYTRHQANGKHEARAGKLSGEEEKSDQLYARDGCNNENRPPNTDFPREVASQGNLPQSPTSPVMPPLQPTTTRASVHSGAPRKASQPKAFQQQSDSFSSSGAGLLPNPSPQGGMHSSGALASSQLHHSTSPPQRAGNTALSSTPGHGKLHPPHSSNVAEVAGVPLRMHSGGFY